MTVLAMPCEPLYSALGADPDFGDLVAMFVDEMPGRIATITAQARAGDWDGLRRMAHQLKGAAGSYGFDGISPAAAAVDAAIRQAAPPDEIRDKAQILVGMCRRAKAGARRSVLPERTCFEAMIGGTSPGSASRTYRLHEDVLHAGRPNRRPSQRRLRANTA